MLAPEIQNRQKFHLKAHGQNCEGKTFMHLKFVPKYAPTIPVPWRPQGRGGSGVQVPPEIQTRPCLHAKTHTYKGLRKTGLRCDSQYIQQGGEGGNQPEAAPSHAKGGARQLKLRQRHRQSRGVALGLSHVPRREIRYSPGMHYNALFPS